MKTYEYANLDAVGLRDRISRGAVTAAEVERVARQAIESVNPEVNALTAPLYEPALDASPTGVLAGVPFLIKDSGPFARGQAFAVGSRAIRGAVAPADHPLMERFRAGGLVTLGLTTAPELSLSFATESELYGVTRNPWNLDRGAGGSSGGAAALVAAGAVPLAHGNDGAGSLRIPASVCGLVGLKPSRGTVPGAVAWDIGSGSDLDTGLVVGVELGLTRTVRDTAALLDIAVTTVGSTPSRRFADAAATAPARQRIAVMTEPWSGDPVDARVVAVTRDVAHLLQWIGHTVEQARPAIDADDVIEGEMLAIYAAGRALIRAPRPPDSRLLEAVSRVVVSEAAAVSAETLAASSAAQKRVIAAVDRFFADHDLLLTPTFGRLPLAHGALRYNGVDPDGAAYSARSWLRRLVEVGPFTAAFNVSGHPAISLPLGESADGLPIGVQLVAPAGREDLLLQMAAQLEQAMPWRDRQPSIFVD